jgi:outer membrane protein assembly factor BamB
MKEATIFSIIAFVFIVTISLTSTASALYQTTTPWPMYRYDAKHTATTTSTAPSNNMTLWHYPIAVGGGYSRQSIPIVVDGMVIFHDGNYAHAVDETTGAELWKSDLLAGGYGGLWPSSAYADGRVYFGSSDYIYGKGYVFCVNASTGATIWTYDPNPNGRVESGITVHDGVVYFGTLNNYVYAINATNSYFLWRYPTNGSVYSSPAVDDDLVCVGSDDGKVYALNVSGSTAISKWNFTADGAVRCAPTIYNNKVFFGSSNATFFAVDEETGNLIWRYHLTSGGTLDNSVAIADDIIYLTQTGYAWRIYALFANTAPGNYTEADPEPRAWVKETIVGAAALTEPVVADGKVFFSSANGHMLYALDTASSGATVWTSSFSESYGSPGSPTVADGKVFVTVTNGLGLYCFGDPFPAVTNNYKVDAGGQSFDIPIVTNSTISSFNATGLETEGKISFGVAGINETTGMCNVTIPNDMLDGGLNVTVDGGQPLYSAPPLNNGTHTSLYFTYNNTIPHTVEITGTTFIPEFPTVTVLPLLITTLFATLVQLRRKHNK